MIRHLLLAACAVLLSLCSPAQEKSEPVRGTWITNAASDALTSRENIRQPIPLCRDYGLNNV